MRHFLAPHREIRYLGWLTPGLFVTTTSNFVTTRVTTRNGFPTEGVGDWISNPRKISLSLPPSLSIFPGSFFFFIFSRRSSWHGINVVRKKTDGKMKRERALFSPDTSSAARRDNRDEPTGVGNNARFSTRFFRLSPNVHANTGCSIDF